MADSDKDQDTTLVQPPSPRASTSAMEPSGVEEPEPGLFPSLPLLSIKDEPMERYNATLQPQATASCIKEEQDQLERRLFPSLPLLSIKDEPIDERYNAALQPQATANRIKELDQLEDFDSTCSTEQLRINAVFSVSGSSNNSAAPVPLPQTSMLAPPRTAPAPAPPLTLALAPAPAPPPMPRLQPTAPVIRCSGCSKVLQRGQTAFLRNGSNHLFCSTPCLTGTSFPPVAHPVAPPVGPPAPPPTISLPPVQCAMPSPPPQLSRKKFCCICHKEIVNLKDLIKAPIGHFMRDFCSQTCMESQELKVPLTPYRTVSKQGDDEITKCSICQRIAIVEHEVNHIGAMYKLCSDHCFSRFRVLNNVTVKGNASTQTDAMKLPSPPQRMLKNKALMCKPSIQEQGVQCMLELPASDRHATAADLHATAAAALHTLLSWSHKAEDKEDEKEEKGEKVRLVPFPVPVMVPVFIPVPMHLYTQYTPVPMGMPIPVPVPFMVPSRPDGTGQETPEGWRTLSSPADEEEDEDKEKDKPASMGDQGSTYSGDLESEAVSPPLSLEMESEGEPCEVSDGDDEREDEIELNLNLAPDSDSDSESESNFEIELGGSFQETARDGTVWVEQTAGSIRGRARECNIMRETPGPTDYAKDNVRSPLSSLLCLIDTEMWETIRIYTQAEADRNNADTFKLTADDLKAFVGLLYLRGITGGKSMNLDDYWSDDLGNAMFKETMSREKFRDIMRYLRFDDKNTRSVRLVADKFAMISEIFDKFVRNSIASYTPGENITVDEQLFPTKARCRFTQYMANKPDKFGIKFWVASDAETKYMLNAFPYLGIDESRPAGEQLSENVVMRLMEPFLGKGRNVTTDNFFTSLALAKNLLAHQTTIVGTMNKIRREMPPCTQAQSERYSTKVLRARNATLTIYQRKPKKNVCILSTMHPTVSTDSGAKKLPNTIAHYNSTKVGVDVMDQMARLYSVKGRTRRWPVAVFYNLLDLAAINAHILYKQCMNVSLSRRAFILELVKEMCANQKMAKAARAASRKRLLPETPSPPAKRRQCQIGRCWNKTFEFCQTCKRLVCGKCTKTAPRLCFEC